ncbi:hypothetical protein Tco_0686608 [Tanacetum coccineum]
MNGDFPSVARNKATQVLEVVPFEEQFKDLKKKLTKNNKDKMVLYNALPKKKYERVFMYKMAKDIWQSLLITHQEETIDSGFARFNTIITSLKALDEGFSSKNYVKKFLRALHPKWRAKVTTIKESKDLSSLALGELIDILKVHKLVMVKDFKIYKGKKERVKSIALKYKKESSDDETSTSRSNDEEYAMASPSCKIGLGSDNSKESIRGTKTTSFVGLTAKLAGEGSTIKVDGSTIPRSVDPLTSQKLAEPVFSPPMSSRSDNVITRKKLIHNMIVESKKSSLKLLGIKYSRLNFVSNTVSSASTHVSTGRRVSIVSTGSVL